MMNGILITCLIILMMWCILFGGNALSLKVNKKPELDNYIAMIHLFDSNWNEWEENGVICYTEQRPSMEGKRITYQNNLRRILRLDFR